MLRTRFFTAILVLLASASVRAASYQLVPGQTIPQFEIDHFWLFTERGRFQHARGTLEYDVEQRTGNLRVVIDADSLDTENVARDEVLKGADWFDVRRHPSLSFRSHRFVFEQDRLVAIEGELTMLGIAQPMRLEIASITCSGNPDSRMQRCRADASGTLQRSRFGMRSGLPLISDEVRLRIQAEAYRED